MFIMFKVILFFVSISATLHLIEDGVERTIINAKKSKDEFNAEHIHTFGIGAIFAFMISWTLFYLLNQF